MRRWVVGGAAAIAAAAVVAALAQQPDTGRPPSGQRAGPWVGGPVKIEAGGVRARAARTDPIVADAAALMAKRRYAEVAERCRKALATDSRCAPAWRLLAEACELQGKDADAIGAYRALIYAKGWGSSMNHDPTTLMRYVLLLSKRGAWSEAVAVYRDAENRSMSGTQHPLVGFQFADATPDWPRMNAAAHYVLGTRGRLDGAVPVAERMGHLEQAIRLRPQWPEAQLAYGQGLLKQGRYDAADKAFKVAQTSSDVFVRLKGERGHKRVEGHRAWEAQKAREAAAKAAEPAGTQN